MFFHNFAVLLNDFFPITPSSDHQLINYGDYLVNGVAKVMSDRGQHYFLFLLELLWVVNLVSDVAHDHHNAGSVVPIAADKFGVEVLDTCSFTNLTFEISDKSLIYY